MSDSKMEVDDSKSFSPTSSSASLPLYRLSVTLTGFEYGVRDIAISLTPDGVILAVAEEKGRMHIYDAKADSVSWVERSVEEFREKVHLALVMVLECVRDGTGHASSTGYPANTFMSGGGDKVARPWTANGSMLDILDDHGNSVNSISVLPNGNVLTGAWDGIAREWKGSRKVAEYMSGEHGTEVLALPDGQIVTGSIKHY